MFQPSLDLSGELYITFSWCSSPISVHVRGQFRILIPVTSCWIEAFWLPTVVNMLDNMPPLVSCCKISQQRCFDRPGDKASAITAFNPLTGQRHVVQKGFFTSVCEGVVEAT